MNETKLPKIADLYGDLEMVNKQNELNALLNQEPKKEWLKEHPYVKGLMYIPIQRVEWLLTRIFTKWWVEVQGYSLVANSVSVHIRLYYEDPLTSVIIHQDGLGACPLQTDKGAGAIEFNQIKSNAVQMALPAAESYAVKDAAEKIGKLFGKDLNRADQIAYNLIVQVSEEQQSEKKELIDRVNLLTIEDHIKNILRMKINDRSFEQEKEKIIETISGYEKV